MASNYINNDDIVKSLIKYRESPSKRTEKDFYDKVCLMIDRISSKGSWRNYGDLLLDMRQEALMSIVKGIKNFKTVGTVTEGSYITLKHENKSFNKRRALITSVQSDVDFKCVIVVRNMSTKTYDVVSEEMSMNIDNIGFNNLFAYITSTVENDYKNVINGEMLQRILINIELFEELENFYELDCSTDTMLKKMMDLKQKGYEHYQNLIENEMVTPDKKTYLTRVKISENNLFNMFED